MTLTVGCRGLLTECKQANVECVVLFSYCEEGDNIPDGMRVGVLVACVELLAAAEKLDRTTLLQNISSMRGHTLTLSGMSSISFYQIRRIECARVCQCKHELRRLRAQAADRVREFAGDALKDVSGWRAPPSWRIMLEEQVQRALYA